MQEVLLGIIIGLLTNVVWIFLVWILKKVKLIKRQLPLSTVLLVGGGLIMLVSIGAAVIISDFSAPRVSDLSLYTSIDLVNDDTDGTDFEWVSGGDGQALSPSLADVEVGNLRGRFVHYPVEFRSTKDDSGYSVGDSTGRLQRALRNYERQDLNMLLATVYVDSEETRQLSVVPYLEVPGYDTIYLGFGQLVPTNQWSLILWREVTDSNRYTPQFFDDLTQIRDEYQIRDTGFLRLTHTLAVSRVEGTAVGFSFRLLSENDEGETDALRATIYVSSLTFMP
jgi:hypothetical protein